MDIKVKISDFPTASEIRDGDDLAIVQDGINKKIKQAVVESKLNHKFLKRDELGQANGVASLNGGGKVPYEQLPKFDIDTQITPIDLSTETPKESGVYKPIEAGIYNNFGGIEISEDDLTKAETVIVFLNGNFYKESKPYIAEAVIEPNDFRPISGDTAYNDLIVKVNTIEDLRNYEGKDGQVITLLGYYEAGDKEPLNYKFTTAQGVDDGGSIINSGSGSWLSVSKKMSVKDFGGNLKNALESSCNEIIIDSEVINSDNITISEDMIITFIGGSVDGGAITFLNNLVQNPNFRNCIYNGYIANQIISDSGFWGDDSNVLKFLLNSTFLKSADLSITRDYIIEYTSTSFFSADNVKGCNIHFNDHMISDNFNAGSTLIRNFINLNKPENVNVYSLKYKSNLVNPTEGVDSKGINVINIQGDSKGCNFDIKAENVNKIVSFGVFGVNNYVTDGLSNSRINVFGKNIGYTVSLDVVTNCDIYAEFDTAHRGAYIAGGENCNITVIGKDAISTNVNLLIKDSVFYDKSDINFVNPKFKAYKNLNIKSTDTGSSNQNAIPVQVATYGNEFHFNNRTEPYNITDININISCIDGNRNQGLSLSVIECNDLEDSIELNINNINYNNDSYNLFTNALNLFSKSKITFNNINSNGRVLINNTDDSIFIFNNSKINQLSILNEGNSDLILNNSSFELINSAFYINNVSIYTNSELKRNTDVRKFKVVNYINNTYDLLISLNLGENIPVSKKCFYTINADGEQNYAYNINQNVMCNGESLEIIVKCNRMGNSYINLAFSGNTLINANNTLKLQKDDVFKLITFKTNNIIYTYVDRLTNFGNLFGTTPQRPVSPNIGVYYFDTDLNKPIFYNGSQWIAPLTNQSVVQANSTATDVSQIVTDFNQLLQKLKDSGLMKNI